MLGVAEQLHYLMKHINQISQVVSYAIDNKATMIYLVQDYLVCLNLMSRSFQDCYCINSKFSLQVTVVVKDHTFEIFSISLVKKSDKIHPGPLTMILDPQVDKVRILDALEY